MSVNACGKSLLILSTYSLPAVWFSLPRYIYIPLAHKIAFASCIRYISSDRASVFEWSSEISDNTDLCNVPGNNTLPNLEMRVIPRIIIDISAMGLDPEVTTGWYVCVCVCVLIIGANLLFRVSINNRDVRRKRRERERERQSRCLSSCVFRVRVYR